MMCREADGKFNSLFRRQLLCILMAAIVSYIISQRLLLHSRHFIAA